jgi:hypothetical protein
MKVDKSLNGCLSSMYLGTPGFLKFPQSPHMVHQYNYLK